MKANNTSPANPNLNGASVGSRAPQRRQLPVPRRPSTGPTRTKSLDDLLASQAEDERVGGGAKVGGSFGCG